MLMSIRSVFSGKMHKWGATIAFSLVVIVNAVTFGVIQTNRLELERLNDNFCHSVATDRVGIRSSLQTMILETDDSSAVLQLQELLDKYPEIEC